MSGVHGELCILDTCVLVHLAREDPTGLRIEDQYSLTSRTERALLSSIVEGELLGLVRAWRWDSARLGALSALLSEFVRVDAGHPEIVDRYAYLYAICRQAGALPGENDLWIAATANAVGAVLYTCDEDFAWFHPTHVQVHHVPRV